MESLINDKTKLINKIDNIINELKYIKKEISKDIEFNEIADIDNIIQEEIEIPKSILAPKKKKNIKPQDDSNGYTDYYDAKGRPDIFI